MCGCVDVRVSIKRRESIVMARCTCHKTSHQEPGLHGYEASKYAAHVYTGELKGSR